MFLKSSLYIEDLENVFETDIPAKDMQGSSVLITGASGLIGSFLVDALLHYSDVACYDIKVFAIGRDSASLEKRFKSHMGKPNFYIMQHDVKLPLTYHHDFDYVIHAASNAHPRAFSTDPVGTIMGNVLGVHNILEYARRGSMKRLLFVSSGEVYGQAVEGVASIGESYSGYIDSTNPRACYPNGKRAAETLCVSYTNQYGIDTVIARPCHIYGPTATEFDSRVSAQFINSVLSGKDIVLKSLGTQLRSYCYVADCASGILSVLLKGETSNAYNISNETSTVTIREMAEMVAQMFGRAIRFELADDNEKASYNPATVSVLSVRKLEALGWQAQYDMVTGLRRTVEVMKEVKRYG